MAISANSKRKLVAKRAKRAGVFGRAIEEREKRIAERLHGKSAFAVRAKEEAKGAAAANTSARMDRKTMKTVRQVFRSKEVAWNLKLHKNKRHGYSNKLKMRYRQNFV